MGPFSHVYYGQEVDLSCFVFSSGLDFQFEWKVPQNSTILERASPTQYERFSLLEFTALEEDSGTFVCTAVPQDLGQSFSATFDLIVGKKTLLSIRNQKNVYHIM